MTAAATCAPTAAPIVRMIRFTPLATPVSDAAECSITSEPLAARAKAIPTPSRPIQASASQRSSCTNASSINAELLAPSPIRSASACP